ncbi:acyl-CoA Delta-9 desaturase-like isoform X2 [Rhodnius prolixus]
MEYKNENDMLLEKQQEILKNNSYFRAKIVWKNVIAFVILHLGMVYGLYLMFSFQVPLATIIWSAVVLYLGAEGVTIGNHRMWTHRSFKGTPALKTILLIGQTIAGQNCIWIWARDHRLHHKFSDTNADPHNSNRGFFFCHMGWLMMKKHPDVKIKGKTIDMSDLDADPFVMFQKKYYNYLYFVFAFFIPIAVPVFFWGDSWRNGLFLAYFVRYAITLHGTWTVNSIAHLYGTRPYTKDIAPVESSFVAFISSGEGWHNYHHTFPWDYRAGEFGKYFNISVYYIDWFARHGYAYDLRSATPEMVAYRIMKKGDGSHSLCKVKVNNEQPDIDHDIYDLYGEKAGKHMQVSNALVS